MCICFKLKCFLLLEDFILISQTRVPMSLSKDCHNFSIKSSDNFVLFMTIFIRRNDDELV